MLDHNEPNEAPDTGAATSEEATAPRRRRRAVSRPAGPPAAPAIPATSADEAPAASPASAEDTDTSAAPPRARRRATLH
ncbi:hypothetical protein G3I60_29340 [Streptomyces sp. SID13666]|uniref:hypothetical protein n=1 Tax=Streptomyces sp. SID13666 TaxID=2706054 RepID=UPI0013C257FD|nr:hypothetical protein [Streptomyces sp. SID13666]NEA58152.1 hypothetical protein [Streptomyces sp. SID13666]